MQVSLTNLSSVNKLQNVNYKNQKQVTFGSNDEFVKTAVKKTFEEKRNEIQQKYKPLILSLSEKITQQAENVAEIFSSFTKDRELLSMLDTTHFGEKDYLDKLRNYKEIYNYEWLPTGIKDTGLSDEDYLCFIKHHIENSFELNNKSYSYPNKQNFIMIQSKNKETSEKFIDYLRFSWEKRFVSGLNFPSETKTAKRYLRGNAIGLTDFVTIKDSGSDPENLRKSIIKAVETAEKRYQKTNRGTILHIENMQSLLKQGSSVEDCIADIGLPSLNRHTIMIFSNTNPNICPAFGLGNYVLDVMDDADFCIKNFNSISNTEILQPYIDNVKNITENSLATQAELKDLSKKYKTEISEAKKAFSTSEKPLQETLQNAASQIQNDNSIVQIQQPSFGTTATASQVNSSSQLSAKISSTQQTLSNGNDENKLKKLFNKAINKIKENKKTAAIIGIVIAALISVGIIVKVKKGKEKSKNTQIPETKQPAQNTQGVTNMKENKKTQTQVNYNVFNTATPDIFSEFRK